MKNIVIIGAGGFAREVAWLIEEINIAQPEWNFLGYIDDNIKTHGTMINEFPVLGDFSWFETDVAQDVLAVCAIGDPIIREKLVRKANQYNVRFANLIHPSVRYSRFIHFGEGIIICAGNNLTTNISIGSHVIINLDCTVGHDAIIEDYVTLLPSINVSGNTVLKRGCNIGTNSSIIPGTIVGEWAVLGAGAIVTKDIPPCCVAVGMPAKAIKFFELEEK